MAILVVREVEERDEGELVAKRQRARKDDAMRPQKALLGEWPARREELHRDPQAVRDTPDMVHLGWREDQPDGAFSVMV